MHYFRKKSFQNTSVSKDHYFLPDQNERDNGSQNSSDGSQQSYQPHETVVINNFTQNAKIKIDILYQDGVKIKTKQNTFPNQINEQRKTYQAVSPNRNTLPNNEDKNGINMKSFKALEGDYSHPPTPIKTPKYNYNQTFDKNTDNISTPINRFSYNHAYQGNEIDKKNMRDDRYLEERKNQRYFNTPVVYPVAMSLLKSPEQIKSQKDHEDMDMFHTPFPSKNQEIDKTELLRQKRLQISERLKNMSLTSEPKEKSFYKVPEFNLNDSINKIEEHSLNLAESDKPFEQIIQVETLKGQSFEKSLSKKPFMVREQISGDFLQEKDEFIKIVNQNESISKNSGQIESEIAEQVQHQNSFFRKVNSKGEIEDLILPGYQQKQENLKEHDEHTQHVIFDDSVNDKIYKQAEKQPCSLQSVEQKKNISKLEQNSKKVFIDQSIYDSQQQNSSYQHDLNESNQQLNEVNTLSITKQNYFPEQNNQSQLQETPQSQDSIIGLENQNILSQQEIQLCQQKVKNDSNIQPDSKNQTKELLVTPGKWNREKSQQSIDIHQYSTRPKSVEAVEIDNQEQTIEYHIDPTPSKQKLNLQIGAEKSHAEEEYNEPSTVMRLKRDYSQTSKQEDSEDSLDKLSEIQKNTPRDHQNISEGEKSPNNFDKKSLEEEFHQNYTISIESTNKRSPSSLKFESVISYSISPSPKNIRFSLTNKNQGDKKSFRSSEKAQISLSSSIQFSSKSQSRSSSKETPRTYQELEKYKRLFKKNNEKTKNPESPLERENLKQKSAIKYVELHGSQKGYSRRSSIIRNSKFIKLETDNNEEYHHVNNSPKSREKIKNYFEESLETEEDEHSNSRKRPNQNQNFLSTPSNGYEWIKPKVVKINLKDKTAEDLFTKHKDQFLNKLKQKEKYSKLLVDNYRSSSRSNEKPIYAALNTTNFNKVRPLSPSLQKLTNRLSSPNPKTYICEHFRKHSRRQLRQKFQSLLQKDDNTLLKKYYFSQDEINQIFVEEILSKEINEMYWVHVLVEWGEKKLKNMRLRSKSNYHPYEENVVRKQQLLQDTKRVYANGESLAIQSYY